MKTTCLSIAATLIFSLAVTLVGSASTCRAEDPPPGIEPTEWRELQASQQALANQLTPLRPTMTQAPEVADRWADADIFRKGLHWALRYETKFDPKDVTLLRKALDRGTNRSSALAKTSWPWGTKPGRVIRGFVSRIDGSTQPYGVIVPRSYDATRPMRLDIVLHGSTRPIGLSELRFMDRFDAGDQRGDSETIPDADYIELHPLGRVENGYRWAGETDVFEAIEAVCRQYRIDRDRIVLRGMSMGASGTWHLGLKRPDRFVALGPYCGYVDTHRFSETPLPNFVRVGPLPAVQEQTLHLLDSVDYAANAGVVPAVACIGEKDIFFDAHVIMGQAMEREGLKMVNLISPGTGHVIDPKTHAEQMRQIAEHVRPGLNHSPRKLRFVTWSLKYADCHWLKILGLERHYARAEFSASIEDDGTIRLAEPTNITRFSIHPPLPASTTPRLFIADREIRLPPATDAVPRGWEFTRQGQDWLVRAAPATTPPADEPLAKRPGLQGPIDDAFTAPFLCVRGTGEPWNPTVAAWSNSTLQRFDYEWHRYFRGDLPVKDDSAVTPEDLRTRHLILFGDPGSNRWIRDALPQLSIEWTRDKLTVAGQHYSAADHAPTLITANPLPGAQGRYLVLNSGHTFHEAELSTLNYLLFPRSGDWGVWKVGTPQAGAVVEQAIAFGLADETWRLKK